MGGRIRPFPRVLIVCLCLHTALVSGAGAWEMSLNGPWRLHPVPAALMDQSDSVLASRYSAAQIDDSSWELVSVPGYWDRPALVPPWSNPPIPPGPLPKHDGEAWYRKGFTIPASSPGLESSGKVDSAYVGVLDFEGVAARASIWLNGTFIGRNVGAHAPFELTVAPEILTASTNTIAVRVRDKATFSNAALRESPNEAIPLGFYPEVGGIHRPVRFRIVPKERITDLFVLPNLKGVTVRLFVSDAAIGASTVEVTIAEKLTNNRIAGPNIAPVRFDRKKYSDFSVAFANIPLAQPWTPENPNLYRLTARLISKDEKDSAGKGVIRIDTREVDFGFRTVGVGPGVFLLNGKEYFLFGATSPPHCETDDEEIARKHLSELKRAGVRMVRFSHEPPSSVWLRLCDELGLLAWVEGALSGENSTYDLTNPALVLSASEEMAAIVRAFRNHPSVAIWSVGNRNLKDGTTPSDSALYEIARSVSSRDLDPTRPVLADSINRGLLSDPIESWYGDFGWYRNIPADWPIFLDQFSIHRGAISGATGPWVVSELETGFTTNGQGAVMSLGSEETAARMRIGEPGDPDTELALYQSERIGDLLEQVRGHRDKAVNRIAGVFPFSCDNWFFDPFSAATLAPKPLVEKISKGYQPVLLSLEGVRSHYFGGEILEATITVANDDIKAGTLTSSLLVCDVEGPDKQVASQRKELSAIPYYSNRTDRIAVQIPNVSGLQSARVNVRLVSGEVELASNLKQIRVGDPVACRPVQTDLPEGVAIYDPEGSLRTVLQSLKIEVPSFEEFSQLGELRGLIIGPNGFDHFVARAWPVLSTWVDAGGRILVLNQEKQDSRWKFNGPYPGGFGVTKPAGWPTGMDRANLRILDHPLFRGVSRKDLRSWGRNSILAGSTWQELGPTVTSTFRSTVLADVVPESTEIKWNPLVVELQAVEGTVLLCQLHLVQKSGSDPIASLILKNAFRWVGGARRSILARIPGIGSAFLAPLVGNRANEVVARGAGLDPNDPIRVVAFEQSKFLGDVFSDQTEVSFPGLVPESEGKELYFDLDDRFWFDLAGTAEVQIQVLCNTPSRIRLDYDSTDSSLGTGAAAKHTTGRQVLEVGTWKILAFSLPDARFGNRLLGECDFRLVVEEGDAVIGPITLRRAD